MTLEDSLRDHLQRQADDIPLPDREPGRAVSRACARRRNRQVGAGVVAVAALAAGLGIPRIAGDGDAGDPVSVSPGRLGCRAAADRASDVRLAVHRRWAVRAGGELPGRRRHGLRAVDRAGGPLRGPSRRGLPPGALPPGRGRHLGGRAPRRRAARRERRGHRRLAAVRREHRPRRERRVRPAPVDLLGPGRQLVGPGHRGRRPAERRHPLAEVVEHGHREQRRHDPRGRVHVVPAQPGGGLPAAAGAGGLRHVPGGAAGRRVRARRDGRARFARRHRRPDRGRNRPWTGTTGRRHRGDPAGDRHDAGRPGRTDHDSGRPDRCADHDHGGRPGRPRRPRPRPSSTARSRPT